MTAIHEALKSLSPTPWESVPLDDLNDYLTESFSAGQLLVDSVPIPDPSAPTPVTGRSRSNTASSTASSASEISISNARSTPPAPDIETSQKAWGKPMKINPKENSLGMSVYKLAGKDGKGAWFARRSVHEGLGFSKWKKALQAEFPETMKIQGGPGEGNVRGIGGERRVEYKDVEGVGKAEVYHLSAQFPGPTTPRDFVTLLLSSDSALSEGAGGVQDGEVPRHFMVVSKPCIHPICEERQGYIRGQYQSIEFIREIPVKKVRERSAPATNASDSSQSRPRSNSSSLGREARERNARNAGQSEEEHASGPRSSIDSDPGNGGPRGKTISPDRSRGSSAKGEHLDMPGEEDEEAESNPVEWIMITRSDPGGSVPRFMIERGTPGAIISDAAKFLDWACGKDIDEFDDGSLETAGNGNGHGDHQERQRALHDYQTNGHLAGLNSGRETSTVAEVPEPASEAAQENGGIYGMITGAAATAAAAVASYGPAVIANHIPGQDAESSSDVAALKPRPRLYSTSSSSSDSSTDTFASASEGNSGPYIAHDDADAASTDTNTSSNIRKSDAQQEKELQKLHEKKQRLNEKLSKQREKELAKKNGDQEKGAAAITKVEEKHKKELRKHEEKYRREVEKLERKKEREAKKAEEKRLKALDKDEKIRLNRELEDTRTELERLRKERDILDKQVGEMQAENTALTAKLGKLGLAAEEIAPRSPSREILAGGPLKEANEISSSPAATTVVVSYEKGKENSPV
ncbi:MAG: hypothetical protein M1818_004667 [Claussenomyces sp. TS43310]|nr:MAG: hypothetical protein M1818_004667 [Claussenomyces sp. TS43310]